MLSDAILPILATGLFLAGVSILLFLIINIFREIRGDDPRHKNWVRATWKIDLRRAFAVLSALALIGLASLVFWVNSQLRLYSAITPGLPLGTISIIRGQSPLPRLVYSSIDHEGREALEVFPVHDVRFRLRGEHIRWSPRLRVLGLDEYFKLDRIEFFPQGDSSGGRKFVVNVRLGPTPLFLKLASYHRWLPFVQVDSIQTGLWDAQGEYSHNIYLNSGQIVSD